LCAKITAAAFASDWMQFRGPNGSGVADGEGELPARLGPAENAVFTAEGMWQTTLTEPRTQISLRLDTPDAGKLLTRLGFPEGVRGAKTRLEGALAWTGAHLLTRSRVVRTDAPLSVRAASWK
jgi:hypothetical protein